VHFLKKMSVTSALNCIFLKHFSGFLEHLNPFLIITFPIQSNCLKLFTTTECFADKTYQPIIGCVAHATVLHRIILSTKYILSANVYGYSFYRRLIYRYNIVIIAFSLTTSEILQFALGINGIIL